MWSALLGVLAAVVAVGVAIAISPLFPIGLARQAEPSPGVDADWVVLSLGALLTLARDARRGSTRQLSVTNVREPQTAGSPGSALLRVAAGSGNCWAVPPRRRPDVGRRPHDADRSGVRAWR